jgi:hypothetical protein
MGLQKQELFRMGKVHVTRKGEVERLDCKTQNMMAFQKVIIKNK